MSARRAGEWATGPWPYFILALGWSWVFWIPVAALGLDSSASPGVFLLAAGILGPAVSGVVLTLLTCDGGGRRDYRERLTDFRRIRPAWYAVVIILAPAYSALSILLGWIVRGEVPRLDAAAGYLARPLTIIPFAIFILLYGPLPEEMGWRGYALDRLQKRWGALSSSLVLWFFWALWHMPLFFMRGTLMAEVFPLWSARFWVAMGPGLMAGSVVMTWVYNNTRRSTLAAVILHFMMNFCGEFLRLPGGLKNLQFLWLAAFVVAVTVICGPATLVRRSPPR